MEEKIMIRVIANCFDNKLSMGVTYRDVVHVSLSQFDRVTLHEACHHMKTTIEDRGDITVQSVSACAVIIVNGISLTSTRVMRRY